jgi:alpha-glucosidase
MELLTRWFEVGSFNPIFRDHTEKGSNPQEPWVGGPTHEAIRRHFIEERYRLLPYIYSLAEEYSRTGMPMMRPLFLEFPNIPDPGNSTEFLWGPDILVSPAPFGEMPQNYTAQLPAGDWYDYWTGRKVNAKAPYVDPVINGVPSAPPSTTEVVIKPVLSELPVFARGGSIIPLQPLVQSTNETPKGPLELRVYPGPNCTGGIYQDDGISFNYKQGDFLRQAYTCDANPTEVTLHVAGREGRFKPWWSEVEVVLYGWETSGAKATLNGKPIAAARYDAPHQALHIRIPDQSTASELRVLRLSK